MMPINGRRGPTWRALAGVAGLIITILVGIVIEAVASQFNDQKATNTAQTTFNTEISKQLASNKERLSQDSALIQEIRADIRDLSNKMDFVVSCLANARCNPADVYRRQR